MKTLSLLALLALLQLDPGAAAQDAATYPWVQSSKDGQYLFKMVPARIRQEGEKSVTVSEAFGVALAIKADGELEEMWWTKGWYASRGYFSDNGRYFVRMGPQASDQEKLSDLAIAFYDRGKLLKSYEVKDLIKDPEAIEYSVRYYDWMPQKQSTPNGISERLFHLVLIDKTTYQFDITSGKIRSTGSDLGALTGRELRRREKEAENKAQPGKQEFVPPVSP